MNHPWVHGMAIVGCDRRCPSLDRYGTAMVSSAPIPKAEWRRRAIANRAGLVADGVRVRRHLIRFLTAQSPRGWVVLYDPMPGEIDLRPLEQVERPGGGPLARFALTRTPTDGRTLTVHPAHSPWERHRFGYRQPVEDATRIGVDEIDIVLVPGLAFDLAGNRVGFGAGFYDRFLARLRPDALRVGISDGYIVSPLPVDPYDVPMTHLASEVGVVRCR